MNVYKYIYVKTYELRQKIIGGHLESIYVCMLFVGIVDCFFYWGGIFLFDACIGYILVSPDYRLLFAILILGGAFVILSLRERFLLKKKMDIIKKEERKSKKIYKYIIFNKAFERIKKEVADEPRKVFWGVFSLLYVLFAFSFFALSIYLWAIKIIPSPFKIPD